MAIAAPAALRPALRWLSLRRHTTMSFPRPYGYIQDSELAKLWKQRESNANSIAIVDVRDDDFEGGNIPGCIHIPSSDFPDKVNELVKSPLKDGMYWRLALHTTRLTVSCIHLQHSTASSVPLLIITGKVSTSEVPIDLQG